MHVAGGLQFDRGADLFDREARCDGHPELTCGDQLSNVLQGAGGSIGAVRRRHPVDLGGDGADALVRDAEFPCGMDGLRPVQVDRRGDAVGSEGADPVSQTVAIGDRLGPEAAQEVG